MAKGNDRGGVGECWEQCQPEACDSDGGAKYGTTNVEANFHGLPPCDPDLRVAILET